MNTYNSEIDISTPAPIPYRIRIGVTGHRRPEQLPSEDELIGAVKKALGIQDDGLIRLDPEGTIFQFYHAESLKTLQEAKQTKIAYTIISPLAEGADRIVVKAVLDSESARLEAILPLAIEEYLEDFPTKKSQEEFRGLLRRHLKYGFKPFLHPA